MAIDAATVQEGRPARPHPRRGGAAGAAGRRALRHPRLDRAAERGRHRGRRSRWPRPRPSSCRCARTWSPTAAIRRDPRQRPEGRPRLLRRAEGGRMSELTVADAEGRARRACRRAALLRGRAHPGAPRGDRGGAGAERLRAGDAGARRWPWPRRPTRGSRPGEARAAGRRAAGDQGPVLHRGRAHPPPARRSSAIHAALRIHRHRQPLARRRGDAGQAQHGRVRHGLVQRDQRLRAGGQPLALARLEPAADARAARPAARRRRWRPTWRWARRPPTPAARSASRPRCTGTVGHQADLRPLLALGRRRLRLLARPGRADGQDASRTPRSCCAR